MKREIVKTADGSFTLKIEGSQECFHSVNGAYTESMHIFIQNGLRYYIDNMLEHKSTQTTTINILEVGFGTGLNSILTAIEAKKHPSIQINYSAIEKYPLSLEEFEQLKYKELLAQEWDSNIDLITQCSWGLKVDIADNFSLLKINYNIEELQFSSKTEQLTNKLIDNREPVELIDHQLANIVYFDAFSPSIQPLLWSVEIFRGLYNLMSINSVLVTYSAKGDVKRALREAGFNVTRKQGPPGKRHITVASKLFFN